SVLGVGTPILCASRMTCALFAAAATTLAGGKGTRTCAGKSCWCSVTNSVVISVIGMITSMERSCRMRETSAMNRSGAVYGLAYLSNPAEYFETEASDGCRSPAVNTVWPRLPKARVAARSEERRVGKECRSQWWAYHSKAERELHTRSVRG